MNSEMDLLKRLLEEELGLGCTVVVGVQVRGRLEVAIISRPLSRPCPGQAA